MPNPHNLDVSKIEFVSLVTKLQPLLFRVESKARRPYAPQAGKPVREGGAQWVEGR